MSTWVWNIWNKVDLIYGRKTETYYGGDEETGTRVDIDTGKIVSPVVTIHENSLIASEPKK